MPAGAGRQLVARFNRASYKAVAKHKRKGRTSGSPYRNAVAAKLKAIKKRNPNLGKYIIKNGVDYGK
jgi:hypothetical protein